MKKINGSSRWILKTLNDVQFLNSENKIQLQRLVFFCALKTNIDFRNHKFW